MTWPTESAGRWLEARGNARPRGMIVIARKGRNRIPLIGLLYFFSARDVSRPRVSQVHDGNDRVSAGSLRCALVVESQCRSWG